MPEVLWYYAKNDQQLGPVSPSELRQLAAHRQLAPEDLIWREGMDGWAPAARVKGLFPEVKEQPAAPDPLSSALTATMPPTVVAEILASTASAPPPPAGSGIPADVFATPPPAATPEPRGSAIVAKPVVASSESAGMEVFDLLWLAQIILWAICILVIFVGGLMFAVALARADDAVEKGAAGAVFASFAIAAYIIARAGERTAALLQMYYERRRK